MGATRENPANPLDDADDICRLSASGLALAYASRALSPVEAAKATLARAGWAQERFNAFTQIDEDGALAAARASEARWLAGQPLSAIDGAPTTIKDIVYVEGKTISYGSRASEPVQASRDAPSVAGLRRAGAIFLGLTTTPELGWKAVTDSPLSGVTSNPWNDALTPGGSSGGAAVAAATGAGALHIGTDGGGSIRIPSSFTGIVGLKPSFGRVAAYPASAFGTLAHIGPMTRTVDDAKLMLDAMTGRDIADWNQPPFAYPRRELLRVDFRNVRIGYWREPPCGALDAEVAQVCDAAVARLAAVGARVEPLALPQVDLLEIFNVLWFSAAARRLRLIDNDRLALMDPGLRNAAHGVEGLSAADYVSATIRRAEFGAWMEAVFERLDLIVSPATAIPAFEKGRDVPDKSGMSLWTEWAGFSFPVNLSQQPACVTRCGFTADGRPIGLQFITPRGEDDRALEFARAYGEIAD